MNSEENNYEPANCRGQYIAPSGSGTVNYMFGLVDLYQAEGLEQSFQLVSHSNTAIEYTFDYNGVDPDTNRRTYCLPIFLDQSDISGVNPPVITLTVANQQPPNKSTSGTVEPIKTTHLTENQTKLLPITSSDYEENDIRFIIFKSASFASQYFVVIYIKTAVGNSRQLEVNTSGNTINLSFNALIEDPVTESDFVVATAAVDSASEQFSNIVLTDDNGNEHSQSIDASLYSSAESF